MKLKKRNFFYHLKLSHKLLIAFIITVSIPVIIALVFSIFFFFNITYKNAVLTLNDKLKTAQLLYNKKEQEIEKIASTLANDNLVILNLELLLYLPIHQHLYQTKKIRNISFISILDPKGNLLISSNDNHYIPFNQEDHLFFQVLLKEITLKKMKTFTTQIPIKNFLETENIKKNPAISIVSISPIISYSEELLGYITAGYVIGDKQNRENFPSLIEEIKKNVNVPVLCLKDKNSIIYSEGEIKQIQIKNPEKNFDKFKADEQFSLTKIKINKSNFLYSFDPVFSYNDTEIMKIGIGYQENIYHKIQLGIVLLFILIAIISCIVAGFAAYWLAHSITNPLTTMVEGTKKIIEGSFDHEIPIGSHDEISKLAYNFNKMTNQLKLTLNSLKDEITERKKTEEEIRKTKQYLRNVFNSIPSILVSVNLDGSVTDWNKAAEKYTLVDISSAISRKIWHLIPFLNEYKDIILNIKNLKKNLVFKKAISGKENRKYFNIFIFPLIYEGISGAVIKIDDVTEIVKKDEQLQQAQKMETVGTLAGGLAHDFNNVLTGVMGVITLMKFYLDSDEQLNREFMQENVEIIEKSANRAKDLVSQLLTLSRKQDISFTEIDLNQIAKYIFKICINSFDKSIDIEVLYFKKEAKVKADPVQLEQALLNLCVNASHAMTVMRQKEEKEGGNLIVEIDKIHSSKFFIKTHPKALDTDYWTIKVQDTGVGMNISERAKIFDPFYTTKEKGMGTGLGLSMVYNIVQQHDGFIEVDSEVGSGSTFTIFLPSLDSDKDTRKKTKLKQQIQYGSGLILVVDDEKIVRHILTNILKECGYRIIVAENGEEALEIYKERYQEINAVILDMAMPKLSGKETYIQMKKINPEIKALLASGYKQDKRVNEALQLGINGFIQKPYTLVEISNELKKIMLS